MDTLNLIGLVSIAITLWLRSKGKISSKLAILSIASTVALLAFRQWKKNG